MRKLQIKLRDCRRDSQKQPDRFHPWVGQVVDTRLPALTLDKVLVTGLVTAVLDIPGGKLPVLLFEGH